MQTTYVGVRKARRPDNEKTILRLVGKHDGAHVEFEQSESVAGDACDHIFDGVVSVDRGDELCASERPTASPLGVLRLHGSPSLRLMRACHAARRTSPFVAHERISGDALPMINDGLATDQTIGEFGPSRKQL